MNLISRFFQVGTPGSSNVNTKISKGGGGGGGGLRKIPIYIIMQGFLFLNELRSRSDTGIQIGCCSLFSAHKVVLGTISNNLTHKKALFYVAFWPNAS